MTKIISILFLIIFVSQNRVEAQQKTVMFDLSHGQCNDTHPGHKYYTDIIPDYEKMTKDCGAKLQLNNNSEIDKKLLKNIDVLIMLSPLSNTLQKNISEKEQKAIINFVNSGGRLIFFIDDEHRVNIQEYGANQITKHYGIELGSDIKGIKGNCGAISFENDIFTNRHEIPYSGARAIKGGTPASVCLDGGYLHSTYATLKNGGKIFVGADTMVGQLMGYSDGEREIFNRMDTRWWGKDSKIFMLELLLWTLK